ncbi:MAG: hypothetical protein ACHQU1_07630 [Gemmatimonadales bacterium]
MTRSRQLVLALAVTSLSLGGAGLAVAQEPQPAPAPAAAPPAAPAVDSNLLWTGDWEFSAQMRDSTYDGVWRINYANGQFTGTVALIQATNNTTGNTYRTGLPPAPVSAMSVRDHFRNFQLTVYFNSESFTFSGHLDNPTRITGSMSSRGGIGRLRAQKRG